MKYPNDEGWTPQRVCFYPDGHRRWAEEQQARSGKDIEGIRGESYAVGAKTCRMVIEIAKRYGASMVDVFLTRPSTYRTSIQDRSAASLNSIHDAIVDGLMKPLFGDGYLVRVYTRSDKPKYVFPENATPDIQDSWRRLVECAKTMNASKGSVQVNLLVNYDGYIDSQMLCSGRQIDSPLPIVPSIDVLLRTASPIDPLPYRLSSGPVLAMAETTFVILNKSSPELLETDVESALERVIDFRRNKKHRAESAVV
jgi:hypothetical protein